jgi:hypothetical protein
MLYWSTGTATGAPAAATSASEAGTVAATAAIGAVTTTSGAASGAIPNTTTIPSLGSWRYSSFFCYCIVTVGCDKFLWLDTKGSVSYSKR